MGNWIAFPFVMLFCFPRKTDEKVVGYDAWRTKHDECYVKVLAGHKLSPEATAKVLRAESLESCQRHCDLSFLPCRTLSYRHHQDRRTEGNCLLSSEDSFRELNLRRRGQQDAEGYDFYERVFHCSWQSRYQKSNSYRLASDKSNSQCFRLVRSRTRIAQKYVEKVVRVSDLRECEWSCINARSFECRGFSYRYRSYGNSQYLDNCELAYKNSYDLDIDDVYEFYRDDDFDFYDRVSYSGSCGDGSTGHHQDCSRLVRSNHRFEYRLIRETEETGDFDECEERCLRSTGFVCRSFAYRRGYHGRYEDDCFLSDYGYREMGSHDLIYDEDSDVYEITTNDRDCDYGRETPEGEAPSQTVKGVRCYRGRCQRDDVVGYWFCMTDSTGEAWDYCCRPDSRCERRGSYDFKWCYVGVEGYDQWRPCYISDYRDREYLMEKKLPSNTTVIEESASSTPFRMSSVKVTDMPSVNEA